MDALGEKTNVLRTTRKSKTSDQKPKGSRNTKITRKKAGNSAKKPQIPPKQTTGRRSRAIKQSDEETSRKVNGTIMIESSSDEEEADSLDKPPPETSLAAHQLQFFNKINMKYRGLLQKYRKLQSENFEKFQWTFEKQQARVSAFTEASEKLVEFHKEEADRVKSLAEAADLMNLIEHNKLLLKENGELHLKLAEQKLVYHQLDHKYNVLNAQCEKVMQQISESKIIPQKTEKFAEKAGLSPIPENSFLQGNSEVPSFNSLQMASHLNGQESSRTGRRSARQDGKAAMDDGGEMQCDPGLIRKGMSGRENGDQSRGEANAQNIAGSFQGSSKPLNEMKTPAARKVSSGLPANEDSDMDLTELHQRNGLKSSQDSLASQAGMQTKPNDMEIEDKKSLMEWQDWLKSIPHMDFQTECPMTGSNTPTVTFTHVPTGFKFQVGPAPRVEEEVKTPFCRSTDISEDEEYFFNCISVGRMKEDLPAFVDEDDGDGILFLASDAENYFQQLGRVLNV